MRALIVNRDLRVGGGSTYIRHLGGALRAAGWQVTLLAAPGPMRRPFAQVLDRVVALPVMAGWQRPWLSRLLRRGGYDVVSAHGYTQAEVIAPVCQALGVPLVVTLHGLTSFDRREDWRRVFDRCACVMVMNERNGTEFVDLVQPPSKLFFRRLFVPWREDVSRSRIGATVALAYCARLSGQKGPMAERWLEAVAEVGRRRKVRAVLVGDGSYRSRLEEHARRLGVEACFTGQVTEAAPILAEADVLTGAGFVALEGIEAGCALVGMGFAGCFGAVGPKRVAEALSVNFGDQAYTDLPSDQATIARELEAALGLLESGDAREVRRLVAPECGLPTMGPLHAELFRRLAERKPFGDLSLPLAFPPMPKGRYAAN